ncbi:MAG: type II toxin-antitoxin system prevent-host-death family antitoxin [Solirubrobacteraceae bacterium]|nr:type II toxin-antitoxin system prevent-host-death family antitoxin [Patulibacter sp.]
MTPPDALKTEVGIRELHDQLSRYVRHVEEGGEVYVTSRGRRVARLTAVGLSDPLVDLRARGIVSNPTADWTPRADRPAIDGSLAAIVAEQRR